MLKTRTFYIGTLCILSGLGLAMFSEGHRAEGAEMVGLGLGLLGLRRAVREVESVTRQIEASVRREG